MHINERSIFKKKHFIHRESNTYNTVSKSKFTKSPTYLLPWKRNELYEYTLNEKYVNSRVLPSRPVEWFLKILFIYHFHRTHLFKKIKIYTYLN